MTYFSLRKHEPEPEPVESEKQASVEDEAREEDAPKGKPSGPILTGLLGPGAWLAARFGTGTAWGVHGVAVWAIGFYRGWMAAGIVLVWLLVVLAFVPREYLERLADRIEHRTSHDQQAGEGPPGEPLAAVLWQLIGDAPGTHLKTLTERLQEAAPEHPPDRAAVKAKLAALGITVKASVRDARGKVNEGVHRVDLQAWEQALPAPGPTPAPEPRSSPVATAVTCDVAAVPTPVAGAPTGAATRRFPFRRLLSRGGA